ncbi:hypothetical protein GCM10028864_53590 [Microlunatus parietis]
MGSASARAVAAEAESLDVGTDVTAYDDIAALVRDPRVQAVWVLTPNDTRVEVINSICAEVASGRAELTGIAIEKPLGRNVAEARAVAEAVEKAGLLHVPGEPGLRAAAGPDPGPGLGQGRRPVRLALPGPVRRGALRAALCLVPGLRGAGRWCAERHDVPLAGGRPVPAHAARHRPGRLADPGQRDRDDRVAALGP